ncbi:hypothetical protein ACFP7A_00895 [Sporolactobacillus kofuensis]|uniref:HTH psq-type domain-containing protein n=1 Tax=Sporolactobacillus kofuensis TaxID=269672 RepID=A0ABW1WDA0_9BACL|nr:hypothetical protein [Sporolactobacillus kofuensis]MCO7175540.1 hypothetical protein [Sporolactobacillus kofuensis]
MSPLDNLTATHFAELNKSGKTYKAIANKYGVALSALNNWVTKHKEEIKEAKLKLRVKPGRKTSNNVPKTAKNDQKTSGNDQNEKTINKELAAYKTMVEERSKRMNEALQAKSQLIVRLDEVQKELLIANDKYERETRANYSLCQEIEKLSKAFTDANSNYNAKCKQVEDLNAAADDLEAEIIGLRNDKTDLEHQLAYTGQERDRFFNLYNQSDKQLKALEAYVLTRLEPEK